MSALLLLRACGSAPPAPESTSEPSKPAVPASGTITGALSYPSDYLPEDLQVCARNVETGALFCDAEKNANSYRLTVASGRYAVWAETADMAGHRAFYTHAVNCGLQVECIDHSPLVVEVGGGQTVDGIDPGDWYANN